MIQRIQALYQAHSQPRLWAHVQAVAAECGRLAEQFGLEAERCVLAGYCHDLGGILRPADQLDLARRMHWWLDPAEEEHPFLLHQRFGAVLAREALGIGDEGVLSAIACHSTLRDRASDMDILVFLADKLAWDQEGVPPYQEELRRKLEISLVHGARFYVLDYAWEHLLMPHAWMIQARAWLEQVGMDGKS